MADVLATMVTLVAISFLGLHNDRAVAEHVLPHQTIVECIDGWTPIHRQCFVFKKLSRRKRIGWEAAKEACEEMGGRLTLFPSRNEKNALENYLRQHYATDSFWIDLFKADDEWLWGDNTGVLEKNTPWKNANIKNRNGNPCGLVQINNKPQTLQLTNSKCNRKNNYICEREPKTTTTPPPEVTTLAKANNAISSQEINAGSSSGHDTTKSSLHQQEQATQMTNSKKVVPFTYPPKTKHSTRIVTMKTGNATPLVLTPPVNAKEDVTRPTRGHALPTETTTTHSEGFKARTRHATKSTRTDMKEDVTRPSGGRSTLKETTTKQTEGFVVRTQRLTKSTPTTTHSTTDDHNNDDDTDSDDVITLPSTGKKRIPTLTTIKEESKRFTSSSVPSGKEDNDDDGDDPSVEETGYETDDDKSDSTKTSTESGKRFWKSTLPTTIWTTTKKIIPRTRPSRRRNNRYWLEARKEFEGCYIPGKKANARQTVLAARQLYKDDAEYCPAVTISRMTFPQTEPGETAIVRCRRGTGFATLECDDDALCWLDQPDLSGCASPKFKALLKKIKEEQLVSILGTKKTIDETIEESVNMTSELVTMTETEDISMEDILVTSEVLTSFTHSTEDKKVKARDKKAVVKIVDNVIKAGNNLFSRRKKAVWKKMDTEDKVRSASSLMVAMESATMALAEEIEEPTVIKQVEENIEMEIQVVDVDKLEEEEQDEITYETDQSDNTFSIPLENLKTLNDGASSLDKVVFITHYSMADILGSGNDEGTGQPEQNASIAKGDDQTSFTNSNDSSVQVGEGTVKEEVGKDKDDEDEDEEEEPTPEIASYILSASIGGREGHRIKLPKPVTFTMRHIVIINEGYRTLCSFWDVSQGSGQSFWSQEGCQVKKSNRTHTTCECDHMTSFAILMDIHGFEVSSEHQSYLRVITIIGCIISCMCLVVSWFTFQFCTALQGERNSIHKNLAACLLVSELLFVAGVTQTEHKITCSVIAVFLHFFFLSAFSWMFLEGLHIIFMLVQVFDASRSRLPHYYITGYGLPVVVVGISCLVYFPGYGTDSFCWLTTDRYFIWAFAGPVALILLVNGIILTYAMTTVCRHSDYVFNTKDRGAGSSIRSWTQGAMALEVLLGLTWVFGYFLLNENTLPLAYAFTVLNSLQGLFIFIFHCLLNKKVQKEYGQFLRSSLGRFATSASSQSTLSKRTNASTKSHELVHSNSASRKHSLNYKHANGNNHENAVKASQPLQSNGSVVACIDKSTDKDIV